MKKNGAILAILVGCFFQIGAFAEGVWGPWAVQGNGCSASSVQVISAGTTLGIIFNELGFQMPLGDQILAGMKTCHFRIEVNPPAGMYLGGFDQVYSGGLIKSKKSYARLDILYRLGNLIKNKKIEWPQGLAVDPAHSRSNFLLTTRDSVNQMRCREKGVYAIQLVLSAMRRDRNEFVVGGLDTVDSSFSPTFSMTPQWKPCR